MRLQPEIHSRDMPSPLRERYQTSNNAGGFETRLPCDDMKVADTI